MDVGSILVVAVTRFPDIVQDSKHVLSIKSWVNTQLFLSTDYYLHTNASVIFSKRFNLKYCPFVCCHYLYLFSKFYLLAFFKKKYIEFCPVLSLSFSLSFSLVKKQKQKKKPLYLRLPYHLVKLNQLISLSCALRAPLQSKTMGGDSSHKTNRLQFLNS